ncbi:MAG: heparinase II/III domain-containing protein [Verrucomicrobiia bacterium]
MGIFVLTETLVFAAEQKPESATIPIPPQVELLKTLRKEHPRLIATKQDFIILKKQVTNDATLSRWFKEVRSRGEAILNEAPSKYEIPDGLRLLSTSRRVMNRIYTLGLLYNIDGDKKWVKRAWEELNAAANFKDWNPRHFLDTAEMTHAFAIGYDWFYDSWTPEQLEVLRQSMIEKGIKPAIEVHKKNNWWARARHNWNQVCNGGVGMGALAIADVEPELAAEYLHYALQSIQLAMNEYAPDGAWAEGPGYWNYATSYNVYFLAGLHTALGTDFGLIKIPGFDRAGDFPIYATGPLNRTFNYADSGDGAPYSPALFWLGREFKNPVYAVYQSRTPRPQPLDLVWYYPATEKTALSLLPTDRYFRNAEVVLMRTKWDDPEALFVGFKAGDNKANHSHLDIGTFVFDALGKRWAVDIGSDDYNLPGYFGKQRWTYYRLRAEGHNTIVLNPDQSPDQLPSAAAKIIKFNSTPRRAFAIADITPAYKKVSSLKRGMMLLDRSRLLIQDELNALEPSKFYWFMHTPAKIEISQNGKIATLSQDDVKVLARIVEPEIASFSKMPAEPLPESPHPERQAKNPRLSKLTVKLDDVTKLRLVIELIPVNQNILLPAPAPVTPLEKW